MPETAYVHGIGECDKRLRALPNFDPFRCKPPEFICACGRHWEHLCDEAEGCMYWEVTDFKRLMVDSAVCRGTGGRSDG